MVERNARPRLIIIVILVSLVLVLLLALVYPAAEKIKVRTASYLKGPLQATGRFSRWIQVESPAQEFLKEKQNLETKLLFLKSQLDELARENEKLRSQLMYKQLVEGRRMAAARVIGKDISNWSRTILLDQGEEAGIRKGMAVVDNGALVGQVVESGKGVSRVKLITDPDSRVGCLIQESRQTGLTEGTVDGKIFLKYIDLKAVVKEGERVITSGLGENYPRGLLVGKVGAVVMDGRGLYKCAWIVPRADFSQLEEVLVIIQ